MSSLIPAPASASPSALARLGRWLDAMPHPALALEVTATQVAVVQGSRTGAGIEAAAVDAVPADVVVPSPVELNLINPQAVSNALRRVLHQVHASGPECALLVPDQVVRVFLLHFDTFPRRADEAVPLLRWRLKKSVPFDVEDTVVSYITQPPRDSGVDVLTAVARQRIIRQYEEAAEAVGLLPGVVLGSTLATLPLLEETRTTLLARRSGNTLTTVIARGDLLCVYRCTELAPAASGLEPQALLDEVYPAVAFYQDTWQEAIQQVRLAGLGPRFEEFRRTVENELGCSVTPLTAAPLLQEHATTEARPLLERQLESLVGWTLNRGA